MQSTQLPATVGSRQTRDGFTLIELLVVITIIVVLLALLTPALDKAMVAAERAQCMGNMRVLHQAQIDYGYDHKRRFAPNDSFTPDYHRTHDNVGRDIVTLFRGTYLPNSDAVICPILTGIPNQWEQIYSRNDWRASTDPFGLYGAGDFGGWDTDAKLIPTGYMWLANFRWLSGEGYVRPTMIEGTPPPPTSLSNGGAANVMNTHQVKFEDANGPKVQDIGHFGNGLHQPGAPYEQYQASEQTLIYADGHAEVHDRSRGEMKPRMTEGGNYPDGPTGYGVFIW